MYSRDCLKSAFDNSKLREIHLVRSYDPSFLRYSTVMDMPEQEARAALAGRSAGDYDRRLLTEEWLRQKALEAGVNVEKQFPIFFGVTDNLEETLNRINAFNNAKGTMKKPEIIHHPFSDIDLTHFSFTAGDSIAHYCQENSIDNAVSVENGALLGRVLTAQDVVRLIDIGYDFNGPDKMEAQLWRAEPRLLVPNLKQPAMISALSCNMGQ